MLNPRRPSSRFVPLLCPSAALRECFFVFADPRRPHLDPLHAVHGHAACMRKLLVILSAKARSKTPWDPAFAVTA
jgi:hypothetical protein